MTVESRRTTAKILSLAVIIAAICVITGWIFDISVLKSIRPTWISMKFDTAVAFVLSGIILYAIVRALEGEVDKTHVVLSITSLIIILLMGILFFSELLRVHTGAEDLFIKDTTTSKKMVTPGRPSVPTMINFLLIGAAGILTMSSPKKLRSKLRSIGLIVAAVGVLAVAGYCFDVPLLYYYVEGVNSAMACGTALLFILLGIGLLCL